MARVRVEIPKKMAAFLTPPPLMRSFAGAIFQQKQALVVNAENGSELSTGQSFSLAIYAFRPKLTARDGLVY